MKTARKFVTKSDPDELELITKAAAKVETIADKQKTLESKVEEHAGKIDKIPELRELVLDVAQKMSAIEGQKSWSDASQNQGGFNAKSLVEDDAFKAFVDKRGRGETRSGKIWLDSEAGQGLSLKAILVGDASGNTAATPVTPTPTRQVLDRFAIAPFRPLRLLDVLSVLPMQVAMIEFPQMRYENAAEETPEGELKPEQEFIITPKTARVSTIAVWTRASKQILDDVPALGLTVGQVLRNGCLDRLERQLLNGSGTGANIEGILPQVDFYLGNEADKIDRIGAAIVQLEELNYQPNMIVMNPSDWYTEVQMAKTGGPEEFYRYGNPAMPIPAYLFNRPVILTSAIARGRVLVGQSDYAVVLDREQPSVELSREDRDNFVTNLVTILAELRAGLMLTRSDAFRKVKLEALT